MEKLSIYSIMDILSIILAFVGIYFVVSVWKAWKNLNINIIKSRVFLDKKFLEKNWTYIILAGAALTVHQFLFILYFPYDNTAMPGVSFFVVTEILELIIFLIFVALAYEWHRVLTK